MVSTFQLVEVCLYVSGCTEMCGQGRRFWHVSLLTIEIKRQTMLFFTSWALLKLPILVLGVPVCLHSWNRLTLERSSIIPLFSQWPRKMNASFFQGQRLTLLCSPRERHSYSSFFLILSTLIKQALRCIHSLGKKNKTMKVSKIRCPTWMHFNSMVTFRVPHPSESQFCDRQTPGGKENGGEGPCGWSSSHKDQKFGSITILNNFDEAKRLYFYFKKCKTVSI